MHIDEIKTEHLDWKLLLKVAGLKDLCLPIYSVWQAEHTLLAPWSLGMGQCHSHLQWLIWKHPSVSQSHIFLFLLLVTMAKPVLKCGVKGWEPWPL